MEWEEGVDLHWAEDEMKEEKGMRGKLCGPALMFGYFYSLHVFFLWDCREAGIPEMLDVDDMLMVKVPDAKSIMTFLVTIYQHFNS